MYLSATFHCAFHHAAHVGSHDCLHHLAGAFKLLDELVHFDDRGAGSVCNSLAAAAVEAVRMLALVWGHGEDDGLDALERVVVHVDILEGLAHARNH